MGTEAISATVLVVGACPDTEALLADPSLAEAGLQLEHVGDAGRAIARIENGDTVDAVALGPLLADPVRVAQRVHSLDRDASVVILVTPERESELRHALEVAPFLDGDVASVPVTGDVDLAATLTGALRRARVRRDETATRHKRRETPPPLSARYLGTLLDSAPIGIVTLDEGGGVVGWNRRAGAMLEVPEVEALGKPFTDLWPAAERERLAELIAGLESSGLRATGETFERDGHSFEITGARFAIRSGEPGALLVLQDVTQRVGVERELRLQKALLEAQSESAIAGIAVVSLEGRLQSINRRWLEMWDIDEETARGDVERATKIMLSRAEDAAALMAGVEALAEDVGGDYRDEIRLRNGRTIERYGTYIRNERGEPAGRIWFHTDITERKRDEDALRFLAEATDTLYSSLDYETTLRRVAELAVPRFADWCGVEVLGEGGLRNIAVAHQDPAKVALARELQTRYPDPGDGSQGVSKVVQTGESELYTDISDELLAASAVDDDHLRLLKALELRSVIIVPIRGRERMLGGISFISSGHGYDEDDVAFAEELARRAAIAIDNATTHAELREVARTLQEGLLPPHLPAVEGVELAARFRPAGAGLEVGGDFYDIFEVAEGQWGIVIGDVCGKGADAAALTALTRYTLRTAAMYEESVAGVMRALNQGLLRQLSDFRFTTVVYCVLDFGGGGCSLRVAVGGHPLPLVLHRDGTAEAVGRGGPLLGVLADADYEEVTVPLAPGDAIALYTDGLTDAQAPARFLDQPDLLAELTRSRDADPAEIAAHLEELAVEGSDEQPRDDIAIVVAKLAG